MGLIRSDPSRLVAPGRGHLGDWLQGAAPIGHHFAEMDIRYLGTEEIRRSLSASQDAAFHTCAMSKGLAARASVSQTRRSSPFTIPKDKSVSIARGKVIREITETTGTRST